MPELSRKPSIAVIGAGIVGLATAYQLQKAVPDAKITILEKEDGIARHQTGRNSGVIHSSIYYPPNSAKQQNCSRGYGALIDFCDSNDIPYEICGKLIVATDESERPLLHKIYQRGLDNGLEGISLIGPEGSREREPHVQAVESIWVPQTGIVNYRRVSQRLADLLAEGGTEIRFNSRLHSAAADGQGVTVTAGESEIRVDIVVNCAGLYSDDVTRLFVKTFTNVRIIPFRGEYYKLKDEREDLVRGLIYPVPRPEFPFLGVHFTRTMDDGIEAGPNAVLAFRREGYSRWSTDTRELWDILAFPGFRKIAAKYWDEGWMEMRRSISKKLFVRSLQKLVPDVQSADLEPGKSGVRAQAVDVDGKFIDDFLIVEDECSINVCNAPSPAATSSLAIGESVAARVLDRIKK